SVAGLCEAAESPGDSRVADPGYRVFQWAARGTEASERASGYGFARKTIQGFVQGQRSRALRAVERSDLGHDVQLLHGPRPDDRPGRRTEGPGSREDRSAGIAVHR